MNTLKSYAQGTKNTRTCRCGYEFPIVRIAQVFVTGHDSISVRGEMICPSCLKPRLLLTISNGTTADMTPVASENNEGVKLP